MEWRNAGYRMVPIAINIAQFQFQHKEFVESVATILKETAYPADLLELELTERIVMSHAGDAITRLNALKALGVKLSIDDFGTGYSCLSYLKQFPLDRLKIDASFIRDVAVDPDDAVITSSIINLAFSLGLEVIAEGVETQAQLDFLRKYHCHLVQGFLLNLPESAGTIEALLDMVAD
jgi:EAL domain-containing protein (putative c-di-GMP-specific phosphodiesterase class I)